MTPVPRILLLLLAALSLAAASSAGPPNAHTGAPGEPTCASCHTGSPGSADSTFLTGIPGNVYTPGATYTMLLSVQWLTQRRWGFELTTVNAGGGAAGQITVTDPVNTQYSPVGSGYLKQTSAGTFNGTPSGVSWTFQWQAPPAGSGTVIFYWCANACNGNGSTSGDIVCRDSLVVTEGTAVNEPRPPVPARRWWRAGGNRRTIIEYRGDPEQPVRIFAASGRLVRSIMPETDGEILRAVWDGRDGRGRPVATGNYYIQTGGSIRSVLKLAVIR